MIVVTGGCGFLGHHLVRALAARDLAEPVRVFDVQRPLAALPAGVEFVAGAIEDPAAVASAVHGATVVVHLAAKVQPDARAVDDMARVNVDGACTVYSAAVDAGCRVFLHMSSAGVYGPPRGPEPFRESDPARPETPYQCTKFEAEERLRATDPRGTTLNILRPAGIYGAGSHLEIPAYRRIARQRWAVEPLGGVVVHPTHVSDVVGAALALTERPAAHGSIFNVGGERPILLQDLQHLVAATLGVPRRRLVVPPVVARPLAAVAAAVLSRAGRPTPHLHRFSGGGRVSSAVDDRRFRQCYPAVPVLALRQGVREHVEWARAQALL